MISGPCLLALWLGLLPAGAPTAVPAPSARSRLVLRNGTVYLLREPPRVLRGRVIFTTSDGRLFSMDEREIASIGAAPRRTPLAPRYSPQDSHALGAIARQQRAARGKRAEIAPRATRKPPRTARPRRPPATPPPA